MARISIDRAEPGMTLAAAITDRNGRKLVAAGIELSEGHLASLRMWGIDWLEVSGEGFEATPEIEPWKLETARAELADRLAALDEHHPFSRELVAFCVTRRARMLDGRTPRETG